MEPELADDFDRLLVRADSALALEAEIVELDSLNSIYRGRFGLYTGCAPVRIGFFFGPYEHDERSREMAETRLQNAGIWGGEEPMGEPVVRFSVTLSVSVDVREAWLTKTVWDPVSGELGEARTWRDLPSIRARRRAAQEQEAAPDETEVMSEAVDDFITRYLAVNAESCQ